VAVEDRLRLPQLRHTERERSPDMPELENQDATLCRPHFFDRQNLTQRDLNAVIDYVRASRRRHNRHLVGWGVASGLEVSRVDGAPWQIRVGRGYAVTPSGLEVGIPDGREPFDVCERARACLDLPGPCPAPLDLEAAGGATEAVLRAVHFAAPGTPEVAPNPRDLGWVTIEVANEPGRPDDLTRIEARTSVSGLDLGTQARIVLRAPTDELEVSIARGHTPSHLVAFDAHGVEVDRQSTTGAAATQVITLQGTGITAVRMVSEEREAVLVALRANDVARGEVYLTLCADEEPACFRPGVPEHCRAPGEDMHPTRILEGHRLEVVCALPDGTAPIDCDDLERWICEPDHVPVAPDDDLDRVVIATLSIGDGGILAIDEFTHRRRVFPQRLLSERAVCRCGDTTTPPPTAEPTTITPGPTSFTTVPTTITDLPTAITTGPTSFTTLPTTFTGQPTLITAGPTFITRGPTFGPTRVTGPPFTGILVNPGRGGLDFDPEAGRTLDVTVLPGIGTERVRQLHDGGVANLTDFIEMGSEELARILNVSEVRVAEMQEAARLWTLGGTG
jgi:hypothetical protein